MKTIKVDNIEMLNKVLDLRVQIFVNEQGVDPNIERDEYDVLDNPEVDHFALTIKEDVVIGTCRCRRIDEHTMILGRFSIHPVLRHQGFGLKFLRVIQDYYYHQKVENILIHAQQHAISFYESAGYKPFGETYFEAGIPHQNMKLTLYQHFYTRFSDVYDEIFPLKNDKLNFLTEFIQDKESVLDIGTATGSFLQLAQEHQLNAQGFDLDARMVSLAQEKNLNVWQMDMNDLNTITDNFDLITCLGNTLAHLDNLEDLDKFMKENYRILNNQGELLIQVVNFNKTLKDDVHKLPTLYNDSKTISLEREYKKNDYKLHFNNVLTIAKSQYNSTVDLYPFTSHQIRKAALKHNFKILSEYGDYSKEVYDSNDSQRYIVILKKDEEI